MPAAVDLESIKPEWFHDTRSYRAAVYACSRYSHMVRLAKMGSTFYGRHGTKFVPEVRVQYNPQFKVGFKDDENVWVDMVGSVTSTVSGKIVLTKKEVNEWLKTVRYLDPKDLKRLRLN